MKKYLYISAAAAMLCSLAQAQTRYTPEQIVTKIAACMVENAPQDWQRFIVTVDRGKSTHKVVTGSPDSAPKDAKPCRADYTAKAVNAFRETQDDKAKTWTAVVITMEKDGRYTVDFKYPK